MSSLIDGYRIHPVTIVSKGTPTREGTYAYDGGSVATYARVRDRSGLLKLPGGREVLYQRVAYLSPTEEVEVGDRLVFDGTTHEVLEIKRNWDLESPEFLKLFIGAR